MTKAQAVALEAARVEMFTEMAEWRSTGQETDLIFADEKARYARKAHYAYLAMVRLERAS